jgi:hypothetical protein
MAISLNAVTPNAVLGRRLLLNPNPSAPVTAPTPAPPALGVPAAAAAPPPPPPPLQTSEPRAAATLAANPAILQAIARPPILVPPVLLPPPAPAQNKTSTQLASGAITQLSNAATTSVTQALNAVKSKSLDGPGLIPYLERKVRVGEVLNDLAADWTAATRSDFADAFNMDPNNLNNEVVDSIISIAILNDKDLDAEILGENTPQTMPSDLTDNRRIVWQSVPPGTVLNPPYVILVAVEYQDVAKAEDVLQSITNQLGTTGSGFRLPKAVIQKGVN